ncbi:unnamed protein product [Brassicogethes aeneus]|uniref:MADF domain-containing protein n=1 Tax=Brassicogethes aeneus TaxID=1431903 RepID=A0A9P0BGM1_BRAAE|nr:unnamed protein product [Brassicogethes aeneus]
MKFSFSSYDWSRDATSCLIQLYEQHPCLYLPTHKEYHNRNTRNKALRSITFEFNKKNSTDVTADELKKKIHGVRTQFLSERQKIKKSEVSGASLDEIYKPKLWCFDQLGFLQQGSELVSTGESNLTIPLQTCSNSDLVEYESDSEIVFDGDVEDLPESNIFLPPERASSSRSGSSYTPKVDRRTKKRKRGDSEDISGLLTHAVTALENINKNDPTITTVSPQSAFESYVAEELNSIQDEDILDEIKEGIIQFIFDGKRKQRERNKENTY